MIKKTMQFKRKKVSSEQVESDDVKHVVTERIGSVSERSMDLMIMEMRKLDRW